MALSVDHLLSVHETIDPRALTEALGGSLRGHKLGAKVRTPSGNWTVGQVPSGPAYTGEYETAHGVVSRSMCPGRRAAGHGPGRGRGAGHLDRRRRCGRGPRRPAGPAHRSATGQLAGNAERLGAGESRMVPIESGVAEVDQVAGELERSARRMAATLAAERDFTSDASHQLRTPLTALSCGWRRLRPRRPSRPPGGGSDRAGPGGASDSGRAGPARPGRGAPTRTRPSRSPSMTSCSSSREEWSAAFDVRAPDPAGRR